MREGYALGSTASNRGVRRLAGDGAIDAHETVTCTVLTPNMRNWASVCCAVTSSEPSCMIESWELLARAAPGATTATRTTAHLTTTALVLHTRRTLPPGFTFRMLV